MKGSIFDGSHDKKSIYFYNVHIHDNNINMSQYHPINFTPKTKRRKFPSQVRYIGNTPTIENVSIGQRKRGRPRKKPRETIVEDDNIVKWIVDNFTPSYTPKKEVIECTHSQYQDPPTIEQKKMPIGEGLRDRVVIARFVGNAKLSKEDEESLRQLFVEYFPTKKSFIDSEEEVVKFLLSYQSSEIKEIIKHSEDLVQSVTPLCDEEVKIVKHATRVKVETIRFYERLMKLLYEDIEKKTTHDKGVTSEDNYVTGEVECVSKIIHNDMVRIYDNKIFDYEEQIISLKYEVASLKKKVQNHDVACQTDVIFCTTVAYYETEGFDPPNEYENDNFQNNDIDTTNETINNIDYDNYDENEKIVMIDVENTSFSSIYTTNSETESSDESERNVDVTEHVDQDQYEDIGENDHENVDQHQYEDVNENDYEHVDDKHNNEHKDDTESVYNDVNDSDHDDDYSNINSLLNELSTLREVRRRSNVDEIDTENVNEIDSEHLDDIDTENVDDTDIERVDEIDNEHVDDIEPETHSSSITDVSHEVTSLTIGSLKNDMNEDDIMTCSVCWDNLTNDTYRAGVLCAHPMCKTCWNDWLKKGGKECPTCRQKLRARGRPRRNL